MRQLDSELLRTFLAVARHGNVTRAARALHLTQSAVSTQIKRLESGLDARLFLRQPRGVALTEAGHRLAESAGRVVAELDDTLRRFRSDPLDGTVRVGIPEEYGPQVLTGILIDFESRHAGVEVSVRSGASAAFPDALARGELDLAVVADEARPAGALHLADDPLVWAAASTWTAPTAAPVPLALFDRDCSWRHLAVNALDRAGRPWRVAFTSESTAGIQAALAAGLAAGVLSRSTLASGMRVLDEKDGWPALPAVALSLQRAETTGPAVEAMVEALVTGFAGLAGVGGDLSREPR